MNTSELVNEVARGVAALADADRKPMAEAMGLVLLAIDEQEARNALAAKSQSLAPVETPSLAEAMLAAVERRRKATDWPQWLDVIDGETVETLQRGPGLVEGLTKKLWREATDDEPVTGAALQNALDSLGKVAANVGVTGELAMELIRPAVGEPPLGEPSAETQALRLELAIQFADAGLIEQDRFAPAALIGISEGLQQQLEPQDKQQPLSRHLERWGSRLAPHGDDESRERLRQGAENSPWLPQPFRETLIIGGSLRENEDQTSPYSVEQIVQLVRDFGGWFDEGLALWIRYFKPTAGMVGQAVAPLAEDELPDPVAEALDERFSGVGTGERTELVAPTIQLLLEKPPSKTFLAQIGSSDANHQVIVETLASLYGRAANNTQRETILEVARALGPLDERERKHLITEIAIPMAHQGKQALDLVVKYLDLCLPPPRGTVTNLRKTLRERAKGKEQQRRVDQALLEANLIKRSGILGRRRKDVDEE